ncbi:hypothetical protein ACQU0X_25835 [Pseudovibrio ascidiaceicola]|uniref:hypothetical protein n=1 Tax=Pseudovibrio ascidiaceicola TaxID=285279 RepID=UPI000AE5EB73
MAHLDKRLSDLADKLFESNGNYRGIEYRKSITITFPKAAICSDFSSVNLLEVESEPGTYVFEESSLRALCKAKRWDVEKVLAEKCRSPDEYPDDYASKVFETGPLFSDHSE